MKRILLIKIHALGDVLLATPAFRAVRRAYPQARITALTGAWSAPALERNPDLDELIVVPDSIFFNRDWFALTVLLARLRARRFDAALIFHRVPGMHRFAQAAGPRVRAGWSVQDRSRYLTHPVRPIGAGSHLLDEGLRIAEAIGAPSCGQDLVLDLAAHERARGAEFAARVRRNRDTPLVLFAVGGARNPRAEASERLWPIERFAATMRYARDRLGVEIALIGGPADRERCASALEAAGFDPEERERRNLAGMTSVREVMAVVGEGDLLVTNDSLPLHVAAALGTPSVSVFGPTDAAHLAPRDGRHIAIQSAVPCSPCYWGVLKDFVACRPTVCMESIPIGPVIAAMETLLTSGPVGP